ncbi:universal stress protein [Arthrobacter sp. Sa2CUA1]|uniref:Universal stress protein n=1 Tax=Arthrobacter gallicola TaxID=2762225 RepID=A0ABR8USS0_9MICC|nr:universal stress protein [Arthrobacter gallicola]MBD7995579.1 universal stress protein [Arthrobacter gallicola]
MRYVVGYAATERGRDALNLACALARSQGASLDLVMIDPEQSPYTAVYPPERSFSTLLAQQLGTWLDEALAMVPADVEARGHIRAADSDARGLIEAADEFGAGLIVVGAGSNGLFKRYTVGSVANALLHAAHVPVALAPRGYSRIDPVTRVTCAVGERRGAEDVLEVGSATAARHGLPLRLLSVLALDSSASGALEEARLHVADRVAKAKTLTGGRCEVTGTVAQGRTIENAVDNLEFDDGEIFIIGSSRLALHNQLFLGTTASKVLRSLPVPMVVVPRSYAGTPDLAGSPGQPASPAPQSGEPQ